MQKRIFVVLKAILFILSAFGAKEVLMERRMRKWIANMETTVPDSTFKSR